MKRVKYVVANWKMNGDSSSIKLVKSLDLFIKRKTKKLPKVVICPPFILLDRLARSKFNNIDFGAQDLFSEENGAFTGSISGSMIRDTGAKYVIIGHSERRQYQKETASELKKKIEIAIKNNLFVIFCIGETFSEIKKRNSILRNQLKSIPKKVNYKKIIIAYEPVWAIGTGLTPSMSEISIIHKSIRKMILPYFGYNNKNISLLYGGSVNSSNSGDIMNLDDVDGALVGGASLKYADFSKIIDY
jgi:triosephosphate isomerase